MAISFCLHFSAMFHGPLWIDIFVAGGMQPGLKKLGILYFYQCEPYTFQPRLKKKKLQSKWPWINSIMTVTLKEDMAYWSLGHIHKFPGRVPFCRKQETVQTLSEIKVLPGKEGEQDVKGTRSNKKAFFIFYSPLHLPQRDMISDPGNKVTVKRLSNFHHLKTQRGFP